MKPKRPRTMTIGCDWITAQKSWRGATLTFQDSPTGQAERRVTVLIRNPGDIAYLRELLQEIEDGWRAQLEGIKVTP